MFKINPSNAKMILNKDITHLSGLKVSIAYDKITGNTYLGSSIDGKQTKFNQTIQILWNIIIIIINILGVYTTIDRFLISYSNSELNSRKSGLIFGICCLGYTCYTTQILFNSIFLFMRGKNILDNLKSDQILKIDKRYERRIGIYMTGIKFLFAIIDSIHCFLYLFDYKEIIQMNYKYIIYYLFLIFVSSNTRIYVLSLIAYKCLIVSKQLQNIQRIIDMNQTLNIRNVYHLMHKLYKSVEQFDRLVSTYILFTIFVSISMAITDLCVFVLGFDTDWYNSILSVTESIVFLLTLCYFANIIPKSYRMFLDSLDDMYCKSYSMQTNDEILLIKIEKFSHKISLTAMNLFNVNTNTFLLCLSLIISYSVILIQTTQPSK